MESSCGEALLLLPLLLLRHLIACISSSSSTVRLSISCLVRLILGLFIQVCLGLSEPDEKKYIDVYSFGVVFWQIVILHPPPYSPLVDLIRNVQLCSTVDSRV